MNLPEFDFILETYNRPNDANQTPTVIIYVFHF